MTQQSEFLYTFYDERYNVYRTVVNFEPEFPKLGLYTYVCSSGKTKWEAIKNSVDYFIEAIYTATVELNRGDYD